MTKQLTCGALAALLALTVVQAQPASRQRLEDGAVVRALAGAANALGWRWRSIGPYRGGRVTAVAGVAGQPLVYYMGATGGGVWKTEDAGLTWSPITDNYVKTGSV
ncbi:MAG TPA: hypothetical protein VFP91_19045, partial [Vicinamibacterales bacterium]|nr:hypothetical protein [Vicinamibacterales bacterium]